jgi:hypothetical protein
MSSSVACNVANLAKCSAVDAAQIAGGWATAIGLGIALIVGVVALAQYFNQNRIHWNETYSQVFSEYIGASSDFFSNFLSAPDPNKESDLRAFLTGSARLVHFMSQIMKITARKPEAFSPVDYVILTNDLDMVRSLVNGLRETYAPRFAEHSVKCFMFDELRAKMGHSLTSGQVAMIDELEQQVRDACMSDELPEEDERKLLQVKASLKAMFNHEVPDDIGVESNPEAFKGLREMHQIMLLQQALDDISPKIHAGAMKVTQD